jgi:radical SAM superfamily enzyme YgiQ (UPF0313 family)
MDILLVNPGKIRHDYITEHLGIASLKAYVISKGFESDTLDMAIEELSVRDAVKIVLKVEPKMLGVSLLNDTKDKGLSLIKLLRLEGYDGKIVIGGYWATFSAAEILRDFPEIDFVIRGEGEITLFELMQIVLNRTGRQYSEILGLSFRNANGIKENSPRPLIKDLDILPPVDRKYATHVLKKGSHLRIYGTRGCWGQCTFCDIIGFYRTSQGKVWRKRSARKLVEEIEYLTKKYNTNYFVFNDDQFLLKNQKAIEHVVDFERELKRCHLKIDFELMCRADTVTRQVMIRLKSSGLQKVFLGLESFDEKHQRIYRKKISIRQNLKSLITLYQLKIDVVASVILANADTTLLDLIKQFIVLYELKERYFNSPKCQISINNKLEIYKGSAIYREYKRRGILTRDDYLEGYDYKLKTLTNIRLKLFTLETNLSRLVLKPQEEVRNFIKRLRWQIGQLKTIYSSFLSYSHLNFLKKMIKLCFYSTHQPH